MAAPIALYLNLSKEPDKVSIGPLLKGATWNAADTPSRVSGSIETTHLYLCDDSGGATADPVRTTASTIVLAVRKTPGAEDLIVLDPTWTEEGEAGAKYYVSEVDWSVVAGTWDTNERTVAPLVNFIVDGRAVEIPLTLIRGAYDASTPPSNPQLYVKTIAQTLTSEQRAQAIANLGLTSLSTSGLISSGTITAGNAGKVAVITAANTLGAGVSYTSAATASTIAQRTSGNFMNSGAFWASLVEFGTGLGTLVGNAGMAGKNAAGDTTWQADNESGGIAAVNADFSGDLTVAGDINFTSTTTANFGGAITAAGGISGTAISGTSGSFGTLTVGVGGATFNGFVQVNEDLSVVGELRLNSNPLSIANSVSFLGAFAFTATLTGVTTVTFPTSGTLTTEERLLRQKRFAVGQSASTISTTNSAWAGLIASGSSAVARLHSYFTLSTSATLANSRYSLWVEAGAAAVNPHALPGHPFYALNYAKGLEISFPLNAAQASGTTAILPADGYLAGYFGQSRNTHYTDIVQVGFGFYLKGDGTIQLQALATNGGTVVKSSFVASGLDMSVNASAIASLIRIVSDTDGNLTLFVDGVSKCTLAGGPTGLTNVSSSNFSVFAFTLSNGAGTPTKATAITIGEPLFVL